MDKLAKLRLAGTLLLIAGIQFVIVIHIAETTYLGYNVNQNYLSDLGATVRFTENGVTTIIQQPASLLFTITLSTVGILSIIASYLMSPSAKSKRIVILTGLFGIGLVGVSIFSEVYTLVHGIFSLVVFFAGALAAMFSFRSQKRPMNYVSVILGVIALVAIILLELSSLDQILPELGLAASAAPSFNTPIGIGGMERMIVYPVMLWLVMFGTCLIASPELAERSH